MINAYESWECIMLNKYLHFSLPRKYMWENVMLLYLMIYGMLSRYIEYGIIWHIITIFIFIKMLGKKIIFKNIKICCFNSVALIFFLLVSASVVVNGIDIVVLLQNSVKTILPIVYCIFLVSLTRSHPELVTNFFIKKVSIFNLFYIVNVIVLIFQIKGYHFFVKSEWITPYWEDMCSGLFGNAGTHELAIYTIFVILLNIVLGELYNKKNLFRVTVYSLIMCILSVYNDNNAFYVLLVIFLFIFYIQKNCVIGVKHLNILDNVIKNYKLLGSVAGIIICMYLFSPVAEFISQTLISRLYDMFDYDNISFNSGSSERSWIILYSLFLNSTYKLGTGFGHSSIETVGADNYFSHGLINSLGPFMLVLGIWGTMFCCLFYAYLLTIMLGKSIKSVDMIINFVLIIILSYYSNIFQYVHFIFWVFFIYMLFFVYRYNVMVKKIKNKHIT